MATVFTQEDVARMYRVLQAQRPATPGYDDLDCSKQIDAFAPRALNCGLVIRTRYRDGSEDVLLLGPVVARHLASCVLTMGEEAGWLDARGDIILPPAPKADA